MNNFEPELGQALNSNGTACQYDMTNDVFSMLEAIGNTIEALGIGDNPCANSAAAYHYSCFTIRAYCWCFGDRAGHENGCPPNFECGDFQACWYKHLRRGGSQNRELAGKELAAMTRMCLTAVMNETPKEPRP